MRQELLSSCTIIMNNISAVVTCLYTEIEKNMYLFFVYINFLKGHVLDFKMWFWANEFQNNNNDNNKSDNIWK